MAIEAEYYRWGRHKCEWVYRGVEEVTEAATENHYFAPATLEMTAGEDSDGQLANISVKNDKDETIRAMIWREGKGEEVSTALPILLVPGEVLTFRDNRRLMDLSFANEPSFAKLEQESRSTSFQQVQD